jgi:cytochrome d ubiquinol oxidase subunit II
LPPLALTSHFKGVLPRGAHREANGLTVVLGSAALFAGLFPRVMVSSLNPEWSLTIYRASSSPYTLKVMAIVALTLVPVVLLYQG